MSEKYKPSNSHEGESFIDAWCGDCKHERYHFTGNDDDLKCDILSNIMLFDIDEPDYPKEWIYDEKNRPICTAHSVWDWNKDGVPEKEINDPNQLKLFKDETK